MKYLCTLFDVLLKENYDLYEINARNLEARLIKTYKMSKVRIQTFNNAIKLPTLISKLKAINEGYVCIHRSGYKDELKEEIQEEVKKIKNGQHSGLQNDIYGNLGYELMPVSVSIFNRDIKNPDADVELLDGFRRMFFVSEVPDRSILVKVYDKLDDTDWINAMVIFNSWKFADSQMDGYVYRLSTENSNGKSQVILDRGMRLGLYYRYGIDFNSLISYSYKNIWKMLNLYFSDKPYNTLWNNNQFYKDIQTIYEITNFKPVFKYQKGKRGKLYIFDSNSKEYGQPYFLEMLFSHYIAFLGEIRRSEYQKETEGDDVKRKSFTIEAYKKFLSYEELQMHFIKLSHMSVPGHMENHIKRYIIKPMINHLRREYYEEDIPLIEEEVKVPENRPVLDISEFKF